MSKATDPRIAPKEMIVTRNKSAQQRMQLREKDRSMTKITELLKSPITKSPKEKKRKTRKSLPKVAKNVTSNAQEAPASLEYHPDKLRRKFEENRVFLRPKYKSKTVVKLNKRKMGTPQRGFQLQDGDTPSKKGALKKNLHKHRSNSPVLAELSMYEVVRMMDETESLDDEDLMEILTCPSPVWWEDPPDEDFIEEAIFTRSPAGKSKTTEESSQQNTKPGKTAPITEESEISTGIEHLQMSKKDDKFLKKRSKLEDVLGGIKSKSGHKQPANSINNDVSPKPTNETDKALENKAVELGSSNLERKSNKSDSLESIDLCTIEDDTSFINDLENMDIPVGDASQNVTEDSLGNPSGAETKIPTVNLISEDTEIQVPKNLPPLIRRPSVIVENQSPSLKDSEVSDISNYTVEDNGDTVSDSNINFILDDDLDRIDEDSSVQGSHQTTVIENSESLNGIELQERNSDYITVYKIVSNDAKENKSLVDKLKTIPEYSRYVDRLAKQDSDERCSGQLNMFFKKCKNVNRRMKKCAERTDSGGGVEKQMCETCEPRKSTISIAQEDNVKYCLNCSSIFDTEECSYCLKNRSCDVREGETVEKSVAKRLSLKILMSPTHY